MSILLKRTKLFRPQNLSLFFGVILLLTGLTHLHPAIGLPLPERSLQLNSSIASTKTTYKLGFTIPDTQILGSIELKFCSNSPIAGLPCDPPTGFDASGAILGSQSGITDFTILSVTANDIILTRSADSVDPIAVSYDLQNIINPSVEGSYYGRLFTYPSTDATGAYTDNAGLAFAIDYGLAISTTVPPYLYFCVGITITGTDCSTATGNFINLGEFNTKTATTAESHMVAATNADTGYDITMSGSTMTSGNNVLPALQTPDVSKPGTSQFGVNLVANTDPSVGALPKGMGTGQPVNDYAQANRYKFVSGDKVVNLSKPEGPENFTVSYLVNISQNQSPGIYVTTMTYVCAAQF